MKYCKELFIHNLLVFDELEKNVLVQASKIVEEVRNNNIHSAGAEDTYLNERCDEIIKGISDLLNNYRNEYPAEE